MKRSLAFVPAIVLVTAAMTFPLPAVAQESNPPARLDPEQLTRVSLAGPVRDQVRAIIEHWLLVAPDRNPAMLEMFADRDREPYRNLLPWSGEFAGKYLTTSVQMIRLTGDGRLREKLRPFVAKLVALQDADGYLGPYPKASRLTGKAPNSEVTWDAWGHYHIMLGLLLWHEDTGDEKALGCAAKIGDLLCTKFLGTGKHVADMGSPDQNQAVIHGLALLHRKTGSQRYLDLAEQIVREFELPGAGDYLRTALAGQEFFATPKPRWESLHAILGLVELHRVTGNADYRRAFEHIWWSIAKLDRHNNGGFSSGEQAVGNPYHQAPIETCCTIAWLAMSVDMLRLTGNSIVADEMELSTWNSIIGAHSADGAWSTYNTPMDGRRIPSTTDIAFQIRPGSEQLNCCSVNAARGFGMISDWALIKNEETGGLTVNWYGPSTLAADLAGNAIRIEQKTTYPQNGRIELVVTPAKPAKFPLKLRIPYWSTKTSVTVNGEVVGAQPGTYCTIDREWISGDRIILDLDFRLRGWTGERECAGKVSLYRGPLLLAHELPAAANRQRPNRWQRFGELFASREKGTAFEYDFEGQGIKWFGHLYDDAGKSRVLIDGKEVAVVDQYGPRRGQSFTWEHRGLGSGKHTIRIEVTGDKTAASRDTWSNVIGFGAPDAAGPESPYAIATIDLATIRPQLLAPGEVAGALVALEIKDAGGANLRLRDFATAGRKGGMYVSWIPARNAPATVFSRDNPLRSIVVER